LDKHCLHGGTEGFAKKVWDVREVEEAGEVVTVTFAFTSPDGDQGFPGNLDTVVKYIATEGGLEIDYTATTDAPTIVSLTNHGYWNLAGVGPTVHDLELAMPASNYTVTDDELIPTGEIRPVEGTDLDFREMKPLREAIANTGGIDTNFVLDKGEGMGLAAQLYCPATGRGLTIETDQPGIQLYTGNFLAGQKAWGKPCVQYQALCLETQKFSDAMHHDNFPPILLRPGETYQHVSRHFFKVGEDAGMCFEDACEL
jgi:aldose 1-epimerase